METKDMLAEGFKKVSEQVEQKFQQYEGQVRESGEASKKLTVELKSLAEAFDGMKKELTTTRDTVTSIQQKGIKIEQPSAPQSMGEQFVKGEAFKRYREGTSAKATMEFKNTILGESGSPQNPTNTIATLQTMPGIVAGAFRPLRLLDIIPRGVASSNQVHYTRELAFTNNAAEAAEGAQKAESVLTFESVDVPVRTIAHTIKVSKQILDDAPALQSYIDTRMRYGVDLRVESQIINGNGTSPNISGLLDSGNYTAATLVTADNNFDLTNRMKYQVVSSDYMPDYFLMNPADWGEIERTKRSGSDAAYVGAGNAVSYVNNGLIPVLWGLPVVVSASVPSGSVICMSTAATMYWSRQNTVVEIFDQNEDDVEKNLLTIRAETRGAFSVFRPAAVIMGSVV